MAVEAPKLRRPNRLRLVDNVRRVLEDGILSGQMAPGARLLETSIATQLGVSRTTVREAFLMLEHRGLVVNRPRGGTFVTRLPPEDALDLKINRALLEGFAAHLACQQIDATQIAELEMLLREMEACRLPEQFPEVLRIDLAFHRALLERAGSRRLLDLWASLNGQIGALMLLAVERRHSTIGDLVDLHRGLLDAVKSRDPRRLQDAVIEHYVGVPASAAPAAAAAAQVIVALAPGDGAPSNPAHSEAAR
ncbi:MAG TPA: GntR family transcriptional regulator [bacterium]|nr:GntR family transcriptional regulator [bacterium]